MRVLLCCWIYDVGACWTYDQCSCSQAVYPDTLYITSWCTLYHILYIICTATETLYIITSISSWYTLYHILMHSISYPLYHMHSYRKASTCSMLKWKTTKQPSCRLPAPLPRFLVCLYIHSVSCACVFVSSVSCVCPCVSTHREYTCRNTMWTQISVYIDTDRKTMSVYSDKWAHL